MECKSATLVFLPRKIVTHESQRIGTVSSSTPVMNSAMRERILVYVVHTGIFENISSVMSTIRCIGIAERSVDHCEHFLVLSPPSARADVRSKMESHV